MFRTVGVSLEVGAEAGRIIVGHEDDSAVLKYFTGDALAEAADATANVIVAPDMFVSKNTSYKFSVDDASAALEAAGWTGKPRTKGGVKAKILFQRTCSPLRLQGQ